VETIYTAKNKDRGAIQSRNSLFIDNKLSIDNLVSIPTFWEFVTVSGISDFLENGRD